MAVATECQTPGAVFHTHIQSRRITCSVEMPADLCLTEDAAGRLEANIHNVLELVLAPHFPQHPGQPL
jgi:hypothetical protein